MYDQLATASTKVTTVGYLRLLWLEGRDCLQLNLGVSVCNWSQFILFGKIFIKQSYNSITSEVNEDHFSCLAENNVRKVAKQFKTLSPKYKAKSHLWPTKNFSNDSQQTQTPISYNTHIRAYYLYFYIYL